MYYYIGDITYEQASAYLLNERETFLRVRLSKRQAGFQYYPTCNRNHTSTQSSINKLCKLRLHLLHDPKSI